MRRGLRLACALALAVALLSATACSGNEAPTPSATATQTAEPVRAVVVVAEPACLPPKVPGNCWLPFYTTPEVKEGFAYNESPTCNNDYRKDQTACWPQPGVELEVNCLTLGKLDGVPWYGVVIPKARAINTLETPILGDVVRGYASSRYFMVKNGKLTSLPDC